MTLEPFVKAGWTMAPKQGFSNPEAGGTLSRVVETLATRSDSRAMVRGCGAFSEHLKFRLDNAASSAGRARQEVAPMGEEGLTS